MLPDRSFSFNLLHQSALGASFNKQSKSLRLASIYHLVRLVARNSCKCLNSEMNQDIFNCQRRPWCRGPFTLYRVNNDVIRLIFNATAVHLPTHKSQNSVDTGPAFVSPRRTRAGLVTIFFTLRQDLRYWTVPQLLRVVSQNWTNRTGKDVRRAVFYYFQFFGKKKK